MQLHTAPTSNFGARVEIAMRAKGIEIGRAAIPPGGLRSAAFRALNPIGKVPVLTLDDGTVLPESETILRYLDARFPEPAFYPADATARARVDRAAHVMDAYVMAPVIRLFPHLAAAGRDPRAVAEETARWRDGLAALAYFMAGPPDETPAGVSMADCVLIPSLHLCTRIAALLGLPDDPVAEHPALALYYRDRANHPLIAPVIETLTAAQAERDVAAGLPSLAPRHRAAARPTFPDQTAGDPSP